MSRPPFRDDITASLVRILAYCERRGDCLVWTKACDSNGYGQIGVAGKTQYNHRIVCEALHGPPPTPKHTVLHSCDNPPCVEPTRLRWGLQLDNIRDMHSKGRARPGGARLTADQVRLIKQRLANGELARHVALDYDVHEGTIGHIARGATWKKVIA